eukprot:356256-Chlamydomonas_euryale.AAC.5
MRVALAVTGPGWPFLVRPRPAPALPLAPGPGAWGNPPPLPRGRQLSPTCACHCLAGTTQRNHAPLVFCLAWLFWMALDASLGADTKGMLTSSRGTLKGAA